MRCGLKVNNLAGNQTILDSADGSKREPIQLYNSNNLRFQTTSNGVSVIGSITANDNGANYCLEIVMTSGGRLPTTQAQTVRFIIMELDIYT